MNKPFPVIHSILAPQALTAFLASQYNLKDILQTQYLTQGVNDTYRVPCKKVEYIFRLYQYGRHSKEAILFEIESIRFLTAKSIPIAKPIADQNGQAVQDIPCPEGTRYGVLFECATGAAPRKFLTQKQAYILGRQIARMHLAGQEFQSNHQRADIGCQTILRESLEKIAPAYQNQPDDLTYLQQIAQRALDAVQHLPTSAPYWTLCAGDLHAGNLHFTQEHALTLFDFDQCGFGQRSFDIAKFLHSCHGLGIPTKVQQAFLNGYQEITLLDPAEILALAALQIVAHLWVLGFNASAAQLFPSNRFSRQLFDKKIKALRDLEKNLDP